MQITLKSMNPAEYQTPALIVFLYKDDAPNLAKRAELKGLKSVIASRLKAGDFEAGYLDTLCLFPQDMAMERIILVGLGKAAECGPAKLRAAAAQGSRTAQGMGLTTAALMLPPVMADLKPAAICEICALGANLGVYDFVELKNDKGKAGKLNKVMLLTSEPKVSAALRRSAKRGMAIACGTELARDLGNRPGNLLYPETLAEEARNMAASAGIKAKVITPAAAKKMGMGSFLSVGQGSERQGRMIILEYQGAAQDTKPLVLVGKAITFDSGGISIKGREGMGDMKMDMSGGAVVLGVLKAAAELKLRVNLVGIVAAAENMPSGSASRPGDVVTSYSGQTIEIISTDAEGRMVLADALTLAGEYKPKAIIDLATLTGACIVALGDKCAGVMGNEPHLIAALKKASDKTGEKVWELPLIPEYEDLMKSPSADMKNSGGKVGGAIYAGLFLQKFAPEKVPWAHLDIAGPAINEKAAPDIPEGASGFGVQLLMNWLRD
jgi:leucyl aminopeptidase